MRGYKIFGPDYTCKGYKYSLNSPNVYEGEIKMNNTGFHFCRYARDCKIYDINDTNTYAIVESGGKYITEGLQVVCDNLTIVKPLTKDEFLYIVNNEEYKRWYYNGQLELETTYANGKLHGSYKDWDINGRLVKEANYADGKLHGSYKKWDYKRWDYIGQLVIEANYANGKLHGIYKEWDYDKHLYKENIWVDGLPASWYE